MQGRDVCAMIKPVAVFICSMLCSRLQSDVGRIHRSRFQGRILMNQGCEVQRGQSLPRCGHQRFLLPQRSLVEKNPHSFRHATRGRVLTTRTSYCRLGYPRA